MTVAGADSATGAGAATGAGSGVALTEGEDFWQPLKARHSNPAIAAIGKRIETCPMLHLLTRNTRRCFSYLRILPAFFGSRITPKSKACENLPDLREGQSRPQSFTASLLTCASRAFCRVGKVRGLIHLSSSFRPRSAARHRAAPARGIECTTTGFGDARKAEKTRAFARKQPCGPRNTQNSQIRPLSVIMRSMRL